MSQDFSTASLDITLNLIYLHRGGIAPTRIPSDKFKMADAADDATAI